MVYQMWLAEEYAVPTPSLAPRVQRGSMPGPPGAMRSRLPCSWLISGWLSLGELSERLYRLIFILKDLEQINYAHQLQSLQGEFGRLHQLHRAPALFGAGQRTHQNADPAGVDHGHFFQVQHHGVVAILQNF